MVEPDLHPRTARTRDPALGPMAALAVEVAVVAVTGLAAAVGGRPTIHAAAANASPASASPGSSGSSGAAPGSAPSGPARAIGVLTGEPPKVGSIAAVDVLGGLSLIGPDGSSVLVNGPDDVVLGFPAWSPDGTRIAETVAAKGTTTVQVRRVDDATDAAGPPNALYRSSAQPAFYVAWLPGGKAVAFLTTDADIVDLRVVDADVRQPKDETDRGSLTRKGAPLYFDWLDDERALLHVGAGAAGVLSTVGRDGHDDGGALARPGDFRAAGVSADGRSVAYIRSTASADGAEEVVAAPFAGGPEWTLPIYGPAAVGFAPNGNLVAALGADAAGGADLGFPVGPLRLLDAGTGASRTLLDGAVVGWFWSPDGRTIFALRLQVPGGVTADAGPVRLAAVAPSPVPSEVHALFVDVETGGIRGDQVVLPGARFVREILPYFDQYALSHRLWAPDSSSVLLPIVAPDGTGAVVDLPRDGSPSPFSISATAAFWSP